jgi:hypothetical protein
MSSRFIPTILTAVLATLPMAVLAEDDHPYRMREEATGTRIPRPAASSPIPLDKRYEEFTPEERAKVNALNGVKPGDEPPFPVRGLKPVMRNIIDLQRRGMRRGVATYGVRVDAEGVAQGIAVYQSPDEEFTKAIAYYLINTDYKPAKCDGKPCSGEYRFSFDFTISLL